LYLPVQHWRTAKNISATKIPDNSNTPFPDPTNLIINTIIGKMKDDTTVKNIRIISGITDDTSTTAMGATTAIIIMHRIIDTMVNTPVILNRAIIGLNRLKNSAAAIITAGSTATQTVMCRSWLRHLAGAGQLKYHPRTKRGSR
jgi:hypothetical protein